MSPEPLEVPMGWLLFAFVVAQAGPPALTDADGFARAAHVGYGVHLRLEVARHGGPLRAVPLDTPVCSGDHLVLHLTPARSGALSLVNHDPQGGDHALYPDPGAPPTVAAGVEVRLPAHGTYVVYGPPGDEGLSVYVSGEPPADARPALVGLAFRTFETRGLRLSADTYVVADAPLEVRFALRHAARCGPLP